MFLSLLERKVLILKSLNKGTETDLADSPVSDAACLKMTKILTSRFVVLNFDHISQLFFVLRNLRLYYMLPVMLKWLR